MQPLSRLFLVFASSLLVAACANTSAQELSHVVGGLDRPLGVVNAADGSGRLFVLEQRGTVRIVQDGALLDGFFVDIRDRVTTGGERGLLGLAFPPDFATSRNIFVSYSDLEGATVVSRFSVGAHPTVDPNGGEQQILRQPQPFANHNGGHVTFGPDGYLYIGLGDGGGSGDPVASGQDLSTWLGTILRIDVQGAETYEIPDDNPFVGRSDALPEIWAWGLRNPWRFSFDRATGDLWIGDVGQNRYEEIDMEPAGASGGVNYGWSIMEGPVCFRTQGCDTTGLELPVISYPHERGWGRSVTGGFVYRGSALPHLVGAYVFADFVSGRIFRAVRSDSGAWETEPILDTGMRIASLGEDENGELYVVDLAGGDLYRLDAN